MPSLHTKIEFNKSLMGVSINLYLLMKEMFHKVPYDVGIVTCMHTCCT